MTPSKNSLIEESSYTPFLKRLTIFSGGGVFVDGYILVIIGIALIQLTPKLELDVFWTGLIGAAALSGLLIGGGVFGYVTDLMGRKLMYQMDLVVIIVLSIAQMFVKSPLELVVLRFLIGIAVGADYPIATTLLTEFTPKRHRGFMLGLLISIWYIGAIVASVVGYLLLSTGPDGWRWMLGSAAIPALILVIGRWDTPESPRWLAKEGRVEEARSVIKTVWGEAADIGDLEETCEVKTRFAKIFEPGYFKRLVFVSLFWMFQVIPCFAIYTFGPQILDAFHLGTGNLWIFGYALINLFFFLGCLPALYLVNYWGRRPIIIWSFVFMTVGLLILGLFPNAHATIIIAGFAIYAFFSGGPSVLNGVYPSELFPTDVRASAYGVATAISRIGSAIGTFAVPYALKLYGIGNTMLISTFLTFLGLVVCVALAPETKDKSLKETSSIG